MTQAEGFASFSNDRLIEKGGSKDEAK